MALLSPKNRWLWAIAAIGILLAAAFEFRGMFTRNDSVPEPPRVPSVDSGVSDTKPAVDDSAAPGKPHPLDSLLEQAIASRKVLHGVKDYTAIFTKRERIGSKLVDTKMNLKLRRDPFSVYLKFVEPKANAGRQVIFVKGSNKDNLIVQETGMTGMLGPQSLQPTGSLAMADNRYPVTMIGIDKIMDMVIAQWEADRASEDVTTKIESDVELPSGEHCTVLESIVPTPREKVQYHLTRLWIDQKTSLAIRVEQFGFPETNDKTPPLLEDYTYSQLKADVMLGDADFDAKQAFKK